MEPGSHEHDRWCAGIVQAAPTAMILLDHSMTIVLVNAGAERLVGHQRESLVGRPLEHLLPAAPPAVSAGGDSGGPAHASDMTCVRSDGEAVALSVIFTPIATVDGHFTLATLSASRDAAEREGRLRLIVEAAPTAVLIVDASGTIAMINRKAETLFGHAQADLVGRTIDVLLPERVREVHPALMHGFFANPTARAMSARRELSVCRPDGTEVPVEIGLEPIETTSGGLSVLVSIVDITARKQQDDELRRSNAELEQFAYVASHDLQEPLRMVASYTELLGQRYRGQLDERADKYIFYAVDGAKRMQRLVADLLAYSRIGSQGKPMVAVAAGDVCKNVLRVLAQQVEAAGATIEIGPMPLVLADEGQLRQLFQNLMGNAIKFRGDEPPHVVVAAVPHDDGWLFSVADNGIGIDVPSAGRIFQMFQRLHERGKYEGSGIGLSIAKRIVERHGGRIWFESTPGVGTTFLFTLRAAPATP
jgi:PAS domain S-box-containing protein